MLAVLAKDSKKRERKLQITGFMKPSGVRCARVINEEKVNYLTEIRPDGSTSCRKEIKNYKGKTVLVECLGHHRHGHCYHALAVECADLPTSARIESEIAFADYDVVSAAQTVANQAQVDAKINNAYEQLAETKADPCPYCGRLDEHYTRTGKCYWVPSYEQL